MLAEEARKVTGGAMGNIEAVRLAKDLIKDQFGTLDDVPKELAITIANLYYKFTGNLLELMGFPPERRILIPETVKRQIKQFGSMFGKFLSGEPEILAELKSVIEKVKTSRQQDKETSSRLTEANVQIMLQGLNSNRNAQGKTDTQQPR